MTAKAARTIPLYKQKKRQAGKPLTEEEKDFILRNHKTKTVFEMAQRLGRQSGHIYGYMDEEGLEVFSRKPWLKRPGKRVPEGCFDFKKMGPPV